MFGILLTEISLLIVFSAMMIILLGIGISIVREKCEDKLNRVPEQTPETPTVIDTLPPSYDEIIQIDWNAKVDTSCDHDPQLPTYNQIFTISTDSFEAKVLAQKSVDESFHTNFSSISYRSPSRWSRIQFFLMVPRAGLPNPWKTQNFSRKILQFYSFRCDIYSIILYWIGP